MKVMIALFLVMALIGCASPGRLNSVQLGMTKDEVISVMGKPVSISAKDDTQYLTYKFSETGEDAYYGRKTRYFVRLVNGKVDSFGRAGDFDSTKTPTVKIEKDESIKVQDSGDLYTELKKLKELRTEGIITEEEFQTQKKRVLNKH